MNISELCIRRPVFATVLSLLLVLFGLVALERLSVREYPDIARPVVSITTTYRGASAAIVENKITQVIEDRIAGIEGILKLESESEDEKSSIRIEFAMDAGRITANIVQSNPVLVGAPDTDQTSPAPSPVNAFPCFAIVEVGLPETDSWRPETASTGNAPDTRNRSPFASGDSVLTRAGCVGCATSTPSGRISP